MKFFDTVLFVAIVGLVMIGCGSSEEPVKEVKKTPEPAKEVATPSFNADSSYGYIEHQLSFGPRVPGTDAQKKCAEWMEQSLMQSCDTVYRQEVSVTAGNGKSLPCINLIGVINPSAVNRILLLTHWDSRPWADEDDKDVDKPILAADDGGSGTAVLLELARQIKSFGLPSSVGVDLLFTDVEDYGKTEWGDDSYCLGTQYWATHPHVTGYRAAYGILLDMVGGKGAQFPMEAGSMRMAGEVQKKVWDAAGRAGCSSWFPYAPGSEITDDHVPVNKLTGIKTIDIIHLTPDPMNPFPRHWHTHDDNMSVIDKQTLNAVGLTLLRVVYEEGSAVQ